MADMTLDGPIGERIRIYRGRRGLSQKELAGLIGRSESWLSQVERGVRSVDRFSVLVDIAQVLKTNVQTLAGTRLQYAPNGDVHIEGIEEVAAALCAYPALEDISISSPTSSENVERLCDAAHGRYQAADYSAAAQMLPSLLHTVDHLVSTAEGDELRWALLMQHRAYLVTAKLLTKTGDGYLAWLAADRAATAAIRIGTPTLKGLAAYQLVCALLKLDRISEAERIALSAAESIDDETPLGLSAQGAFFLIAAIIAARRGDRRSATERLRRAQYLADALGEDANHGWTAFGPTNVALHQISVATELGDAQAAIQYANEIDTSNLPETLRSRRAQVHIDAAWAYLATQGRRCSCHQPHGSRKSGATDTALQRAGSRPHPRALTARTTFSDTRPADDCNTGRAASVTETRTLYMIGAAAPPVRDIDHACRMAIDLGWNPYVVLTPTAATWVDLERVAQASSNVVRVHPRLPDQQDPLPPADAVLAAPLTFNTINKWAAGISDTLALGLLNELLVGGPPIVAAPCAKKSLTEHPAYRASIQTLGTVGVKFVDQQAHTSRGADGLVTLDWLAVLKILSTHT